MDSAVTRGESLFWAVLSPVALRWTGGGAVSVATVLSLKSGQMRPVQLQLGTPI